ncbi:GNAT family N-acetyltransferase [Croceicoccus bisphenolivorans]|uniref:GNAT family N-acetyltransferase n=1 Tax=Croceicoccus bisphenolivorans TaxID=1783232 RepID=UPI00082EFCFE|nr:GNAT family N-acetyltransferase [Croceicoccus bisphenolivorans]
MIRQACLNDLDAVVPLFDAYRVFYGQESDPQLARAFLLDRFRNRQSVIFIAGADEVLLGFTQLYPSYSSVRCAQKLILNDLFVAVDARGKGVAQELIKAAANYAKSIGAIGLSLITANENLEAQRLYEKTGWIRETIFQSYNLEVK